LGFHNLTGWRIAAGRESSALHDYVSPRFTAVAILAALEHRRRKGRVYIDQSQAEASAHFLGPAILDYTANGHEQTRVGTPTRTSRRTARIARRRRPMDGDSSAGATTECARFAKNGRADLAGDARFATRARGSSIVTRSIARSRNGRARWSRSDRAQLAGARCSAHLVQSSADCSPTRSFAIAALRRARAIRSTATIVEGPRVALSRTPAKRSAAHRRSADHDTCSARSCVTTKRGSPI